MKNIEPKKNIMIKFLDEEYLDEVVQLNQWRLKYSIANETNVSAMSIFQPIKSICRTILKANIEADLKETFKIC